MGSTNYKMTKSKMVEYLMVLTNALDICGKFTIINDIIDPTIPDNETEVDDGIFGCHRLRHPFPLPTGRVFHSVPNLREVISTIKSKTGVKSIYLSYTETSLGILIDDLIYVLAASDGVNTEYYRTYGDIVNLYMKDPVYVFEDEQLDKCRKGFVITIHNEKYGPVRLSKSNFPFQGVARSNSPVNFSGRYSYGYYNEELNECYIAMSMKYKNCEAFHMYVFVPFIWDI